MSISENKMPCPNCKREHGYGAYRQYLQSVESKSGEHGGSSGFTKIVACPPDITCTCGVRLRVVVPLFATDPKGWHWRILGPAEPYRDELDPDPREIAVVPLASPQSQERAPAAAAPQAAPSGTCSPTIDSIMRDISQLPEEEREFLISKLTESQG